MYFGFVRESVLYIFFLNPEIITAQLVAIFRDVIIAHTLQQIIILALPQAWGYLYLLNIESFIEKQGRMWHELRLG